MNDTTNNEREGEVSMEERRIMNHQHAVLVMVFIRRWAIVGWREGVSFRCYLNFYRRMTLIWNINDQR